MVGKKNQSNQLCELIAVTGELPAAAVYRLGGGGEYKQDLITRLKKTGVIKVHYRNKLRGYRLMAKTKQMFLADNPDRFEFFLTGNVETNIIQSDITRRLRLHRIANVMVTVYNADIALFRDEKPKVFSPGNSDDVEIVTPAFYGSREFKEIDYVMVKVQNARAVGILLTCKDIFIVYNTENYVMKWDSKAEMAVKVIIRHYLCLFRMSNQYFSLQPVGLLFGNSMEMLYKVMTGGDRRKRGYFFLDNIFDRFIYLTNDRYGEVLLKLLCDRDRRDEFDRVLVDNMSLSARSRSGLIENDAMDEQGNPVLFAYLPDMPRLARFVSALSLHDKVGTVICFDFQEGILSKYCGKQVGFYTIDFDEFVEAFFPASESTESST